MAAVWLAPPIALLSVQPGEGAGLTVLDAPLFTHETLVEQARTLASRPYQEPEKLNGPGLDMSYDQYRSIAFDRSQAVWADTDSAFRMEMFHPGFLYDAPVGIGLVDGEEVTPLQFAPEQFTYGGTAKAPPSGEGLTYSGFRVHSQINRPDVWDEFAVFQGATYFRAVGAAQAYGLSARGLAIGTGDPRGEEFPYFRKFWIETPSPGDVALTAHALMDSPSVTGAYKFTMTPGAMTVVDVEMTLFPRRPLTTLGVAPLTSMFLFDQTNRRGFDDFRNAVHDSDGLQILNGNGEQIWRPLANPRRLQISAFLDDRPRGFGLMQRKRKSADFGDFTADYEKRPSAWVEPIGDWGRGSVVLVEIPTERESNDNIVAFWRPSRPVPVGEPYHLAYRIYWDEDAPIGSAMMRVAHTRVGASNSGARFFAVDFDRGMSTVPFEDLKVTASSSDGRVRAPHLELDEDTGLLRATFELYPENANLAELRLQLTAGGKPASEIWMYRWTPG